MSLRDSLNDGHLKPHRTSVREVAGLLRLADRDLADAVVAGLSADYFEQCRTRRNTVD